MKYVAWFLGAVGIILAVIFGSILIRNTLRGDAARRAETASSAGAVERVKLSDYKKSGVTVKMTIEGPVVADENYRELEVSVSNSNRTAKVIHGYRGTVAKEVSYTNNQEAFSTFLDALENAGYTTERNVEKKDYAGECASGRRYVFDLIENGNTVKSLWRSTCTDIAPGTLGAMATPISELFRLQIPEADTLLAGQNVSF